MSSLRVLLLASILALSACDLRPEDYSRVTTSAQQFHARWSARIAEVQAVRDALATRIGAVPPDTSGVENVTKELGIINDTLADLAKARLPAAEAEVQTRVSQRQKYLAEEALRHGSQDLEAAIAEVNTALEVQKTVVEIAEQAAAETKKTQDAAVADNAMGRVADIVDPAFAQKVGASDVLGIGFEPGTAKFENNDDTKAALMRLVALTASCEGIRVELVAHTAKDGDPEVNARVSTAQAEAVRQYMIGSGVSDAKIAKASGVGGTQPATAEPDAGSDAEKAMDTGKLATIRARNRRITVKVVVPCPPPANPA